MKVFVAGASGAIGGPLVRRLAKAGYEVVGMSRHAERAARLHALGARAVICDVYDAEHLRELIIKERPEIVVDQLTDLSGRLDPKQPSADLAGNNRIRTEGTRNLMAAALAGGARRFVAQSYLHVYAPRGAMVKSEEEALDVGPAVPPLRRRTAEAVHELERIVLTTPGIEGSALRYGSFYGSGTTYAPDGTVARAVRAGCYPVIGAGSGVTSFVHIEDAAAATVLALTAPPGLYNVCDDEPAPVSAWLLYLVRLLDAPTPRRLSPTEALPTVGELGVFRQTQQRGGSNVKARQVLRFRPAFESWRVGFRVALLSGGSGDAPGSA